MKCESKNEYGWSFIDNFQKWKKHDMHLELRLLMFLKFMKKTMSISLGTYEQKGGGPQIGKSPWLQGEANYFHFCWNLIVFYCVHKSGAPTGTEPHEERQNP